MKRERQEPGGLGGGGASGGGGFYGQQHPPQQHCKGKSSMMDDEHDASEDELLAALGYKVRASSMADVAQKLEQLEMAMAIGGGGPTSAAAGCGSSSVASAAAPFGFTGRLGGGGMLVDDNTVLSHLALDTVHYNPSDLSSWLESMLSELNVPALPPPPPAVPHQAVVDPVAALQQPQVMDPVPIPHPNPLLYGGMGNRQHQSQPQHLPPLPLAAPVAGPQALLIEDTLGPGESSTVTSVDFPSPCSKRATDLDDLSAIIPRAALAEPDAAAGTVAGRENKRIKSTASSSSSSTATAPAAAPKVGSSNSGSAPGVLSSNNNNKSHSTPPTSVVLVDSQETGIRLVHALLACAEAVQQENLTTADALVKQIGVLAMSQGGAMRKVATYFAEALARRIYRVYPPQDLPMDSAFSDILQLHFYEACPYLKFAHFTANQAILEAFAGKRRVHVIDFSMKQGMQWPALMQALALRPEGPPSFRLTGIGPPQPDNTDALQQVGWKLAQLADSIHVQFEYRGFVASSLADLEPYMLDLGGGKKSVDGKSHSGGDADDSDASEEVIAVNSVFELHRLLGHPGAVEKVLGTIKALRPVIVTIVEQEANHNCPVFLDRFTEALHYYSSMFDSLEGCGGAGNSGAAGGAQQQPGGGGGSSSSAPGGDGQQDQVMTEVYLGRQICNVVACEGPDRTERHETAAQWRSRMNVAGFEAVPLGSNAFKQASMLLELFAGGDGYRVQEDGCLMLGWHTRPLITTSAWRLPSSSAAAAPQARHQRP